jgi:hypothetical protein
MSGQPLSCIAARLQLRHPAAARRASPAAGTARRSRTAKAQNSNDFHARGKPIPPRVDPRLHFATSPRRRLYPRRYGRPAQEQCRASLSWRTKSARDAHGAPSNAGPSSFSGHAWSDFERLGMSAREAETAYQCGDAIANSGLDSITEARSYDMNQERQAEHPDHPVANPDRPDQGRPSRRRHRASGRRSDDRRCSQAARLRDRPVRARTTSATATSSCRPHTASTSFSATSTT